MPIPRVFVSSTCYDLHYIRENLRFFIRNMGFEPVLSERGNVFYDPKMHAQDACLAEVSTCQIFVLIIGGRFGHKYKDTSKSIVNYEYKNAIESKIPVFALVEQQVNAEFLVFEKNKEKTDIDATRIDYPSVDSTRIFDFMEEVQSNSINNALVPFSDYDELESYLRQQWAGMMFNFLAKQSESGRVASLLETLATMSDKIEFLAKEILGSVGTNIAKINAKIYEVLQKHESFSVLKRYGIEASSAEVVKNIDFRDLFKDKNVVLEDKDKKVEFALKAGRGIKKNVWISKMLFPKLERDYEEMRHEVLMILKKNRITPEQFIREYSQPAK
jgi:hypothetical protein